MIHIVKYSGYEMCLELSHEVLPSGDTAVSTTVLYSRYTDYKNDEKYKGLEATKIPRSMLDSDTKRTFDKVVALMYQAYLDLLT